MIKKKLRKEGKEEVKQSKSLTLNSTNGRTKKLSKIKFEP